MVPLQKRNNRNAAAEKDATQDVETGWEDIPNPVHPVHPVHPVSEPKERKRMTLAKQYGLAPLQPQRQPEPQPQLHSMRDACAAHIEFKKDGDDEDEDDCRDGSAQDDAEEFDVVVDVKTSDGGTREQNFMVKQRTPLGVSRGECRCRWGCLRSRYG